MAPPAAASPPPSVPASEPPLFKLWPPSSRTREHVVERLTSNLSSLSEYYTLIDPSDAARQARLIELAAFEEAVPVSGLGEEDQGDEDSTGATAVKRYAKIASKFMLEVLRGERSFSSSHDDSKTVGSENGLVQESVLESTQIANGGDESDLRSEESESSEGSGNSSLSNHTETVDANMASEATAEAVEVTKKSGDAKVFDISGGRRDFLTEDMALDLLSPLQDLNTLYSKVRLSNWSFGKEAALVAAKALEAVKENLLEVDLSDIVAGRPEAEALEAMSIISSALEGSKLNYLNLSDNALGEKGVRAFKSLLKSQMQLNELFFMNNGISEEAAHAISELLPCSKELKVLHFHNNMSGDKGAQALAQLITAASSLQDFRFSSSRVATAGALALANALRSGSSLRRIDLRDNMFGPKVGHALGQTLSQHVELSEVYLSDLSLQDEGIIKVLEALEEGAPNLKVLELGNNEITEEAAPNLVSCLSKKPFLEKLNLAENELKDAGAVLVCNAIVNCCENLKELDLSLNELSHIGAIAAANAVTNKSNFALLNLDSNHISEKGLEVVYEKLKSGCNGISVLAPFEDNQEVDDSEDSNEDVDDLEEKLDSLSV